MKKIVPVVFWVLVTSFAVAAQSRMTPPARSPIPLEVAPAGGAKAQPGTKPNSKAPAKADIAPPAPAGAAVMVKIPTTIHSRVSSGNAAIDALVVEAAAHFGLDPHLILSVMRQESGFNRSAVSPKGASGLMQLMPATAARFGVRNIFDVRENIFGGARYLRWLLDRFDGDVRLALAGYNAGEGAVEFYGYRIPPFAETQNYVRAIYARYVSLRAVSLPQTSPQTPVQTSPEAPAASATVVKEKAPSYNQIIVFKAANGRQEEERRQK